MGLIKLAIGDIILTFIWVFSTPFLGILTSIIPLYIKIEPKSFLALFITINLATLRLYIINFIGAILGGASFNPTAAVSLYAAGLKKTTSLMSMAVRFPAQAVGGVLGALAIVELIPRNYAHMVKGLSLNVDLQTGALLAIIFSFFYCFSLISVIIKGPKYFLLKLWLVAWARTGIAIVINWKKQTGIIINPASAYGWAYLNNLHNNWEFFYVYWIAPFIGAILAAWVIRFMLNASIKHKQA